MLTPPIELQNSKESQIKTTVPSKSFGEVFSEAYLDTDSVKFSKHAVSRLSQRDIKLDSGEIKKLSSAVDEASSKGVKDSLILMDGLAFIVSVKDRTVVTAMLTNEAESNVFTNIDGAVIA
jgi:flagellar operon protein